MAEAIRRYEDSLFHLRELIADLSDAEREHFWAEIEQALRRFAGPNGFEALGESLGGVGLR